VHKTGESSKELEMRKQGVAKAKFCLSVCFTTFPHCFNCGLSNEFKRRCHKGKQFKGGGYSHMLTNFWKNTGVLY